MKKILMSAVLALAIMITGCSTLGNNGNAVDFALDVAKISAQVAMVEGKLDESQSIMAEYYGILAPEEIASLEDVKKNVVAILDDIKAMRDGAPVTYHKIVELALFADENYLVVRAIAENHWDEFSEYTKASLKMIDNNVIALRENMDKFMKNPVYASGEEGVGITLEEILMIVSVVGPML